ncbi:response regulator [Flaviaesturariibacter aridisoli]|uniref:Response regulator n=1 Tax=Flaviaesturariibacter aridisoli TaxID=2545761 RepID=A0A4V2WNB0_9BACT|nr:response regulator [Flaviaesturariibacter aridisoli]TCZ74762.1 response regulator [Flaviaesturariibacter aridisoli]
MHKPNVILYADDDADDREMLHDVFLECSNYSIVAFATGDELIDFLGKHRDEICAVILDINMPPKSGIQVLKEIRQDESLDKLPVVIYTTASNPLERKVIEQLDALILKKPTSCPAMKEIVQRVLEYCAAFQAQHPLSSL